MMRIVLIVAVTFYLNADLVYADCFTCRGFEDGICVNFKPTSKLNTDTVCSKHVTQLTDKMQRTFGYDFRNTILYSPESKCIYYQKRTKETSDMLSDCDLQNISNSSCDELFANQTIRGYTLTKCVVCSGQCDEETLGRNGDYGYYIQNSSVSNKVAVRLLILLGAALLLY